MNCCILCFHPRHMKPTQFVCDDCRRKAPQEEFRKGFAEIEREWARKQEVGH